MPKHKNSKAEDFDMTFVLKDSRGYKCVVCPSMSQSEASSVHRIRKHVLSKSHLQHVAHHKLRELDVDPSIPILEPLGLPLSEVMDCRSDTAPPSLATDSVLGSSDSGSVDAPVPPTGPPEDSSPSYNFFDDFIYQDFDDEDEALNPILGFEPPLDTPSRAGPDTSTRSFPSKPNYPPLPNHPWEPFPDRAHCLTYSLFNTAHIRFSRAEQEAILDWGREMGAPQVPTLHSLRACQEELRDIGGDGPRMFKSDSGSVYYVNPVDNMVKQDFSTSHVREHLRFYPNDGDGPCSEFWDSGKLAHGENLSQLTPMAMNGKTHYFVNEICRLLDDSLFIPSMFFQRGQELWARGHQLVSSGECGTDNQYQVVCESVERPLVDFREDCIQLQSIYPRGLVVAGGSTAYTLAPHELREQADGRPVYSTPFILFVDDVSGNISKQWNKHWCAYTSNASLPREQMNKRSNIRFMATSQHASPLEMLDGVCTVFKEAFEKMVTVYDIKQQREVLVRPYILVVTGDNPMQATECSHIGMKGSLFCRTCDIGGSNVYKASDKGYAEIFKPGSLRSVEGTIASINKQYEAAFTSTNADVITTLQRQTGVKDAIAQPLLDSIVKQRQLLQKERIPMSQITQKLRTDFSMRGPVLKMNPLLLQPGLDVHLDTPTETLHTILLGIVKYLWGQSVYVLDKGKSFDTFTTRLRSISVDGLATPPVPNYIFTNRGSLNGKHFKILVQTAPFCLYDLVPKDLFDSWRAVGRLTVLLWYTTIHDKTCYLAATDDLLHTLAKCSPRLLSDKGKTHLLVHITLFIQRHGPMVGCNTERYESFNSSFRQCSILSNRHAPSLDIAKSFYLFDQTKHIVLGGYYFDPVAHKFRQAGAGVLQLGQFSRFVSRIFGLAKDKAAPIPGSTTVRQKAVQQTWSSTKSHDAICPAYIRNDTKIKLAVSFIAQNGDIVEHGNHIVYQSTNALLLGCVHEIIVPTGTDPPCITLYPFSWGVPDVYLQLPSVQRQPLLEAIPVSSVLGHINLQHRCAHTGCSATATQTVRQERQESGVKIAKIAHADDNNFVVNTFALHNHELIAKLVEYHMPGFLTTHIQDSLEHDSIRLQAAQQARKPKNTETVETASGKAKAKAKTQEKKKTKGKSKAEGPEQSQAAAGSSSLAAGTSRHIAIADDEMPIGWNAHWSDEHRTSYFHNSLTGETTWRDPRLM